MKRIIKYNHLVVSGIIVINIVALILTVFGAFDSPETDSNTFTDNFPVEQSKVQSNLS